MREKRTMPLTYGKPVYTKISLAQLSDEVLMRTDEENNAREMNVEVSNRFNMSKSVQKYISLLAKSCAKDILKELIEIVKNNQLEDTEIELKVFAGWASLEVPSDTTYEFRGFYNFVENDIVRNWYSYYRDEIANTITMILDVIPTDSRQERWCIIVTA